MHPSSGMWDWDPTGSQVVFQNGLQSRAAGGPETAGASRGNYRVFALQRVWNMMWLTETEPQTPRKTQQPCSKEKRQDGPADPASQNQSVKITILNDEFFFWFKDG